MTDAEFAGMVDGILACVRHDPDIETKGAEAVAREHILSGLHRAHAEGLEAGRREMAEVVILDACGTECHCRAAARIRSLIPAAPEVKDE